MTIIWAKEALTPKGWETDVRIKVDAAGVIEAVDANSSPHGDCFGLIIPAPANLHSHGFQRALAGLTENRSRVGSDSFWTWRNLMYGFINELTPEELEAVTAYSQIEMLESGFAAAAEFHYVHHQANGLCYADIAELSARVVAAAEQSGIGLTLLPVYYQYGGCQRKPALPQQQRFINTLDSYLSLFEEASRRLRDLPPDSGMGIAAHSLRAVDPTDLGTLRDSHPDLPFHLHVAEQEAEVDEFKTCYDLRPVEWLLRNANLNDAWCLVHATHMTDAETHGLAKTGAVAGLCPITEANLGDGIFNGVEFADSNGHYGVGTDSNIRISLCEELRTLEYSQRLKHKGRALMAQPGQSCGRVLFESALLGGSLALGRSSGAIAPGNLADLLALNSESDDLAYCQGDQFLDTFIFSGDNGLVSDVWSAGRHVVKDGQHINRQCIQDRYLHTKKKILGRLM